MKYLALVMLFLALCSSIALGDSTSTIRRSDGTTAGTVTRTGNSSTWRNSDGETIYTGQRSGDTWSYRNSDGELEWTEDEEWD